MSSGFTAEMASLGLWYTRRLLASGEIREAEIGRALSRRVDTPAVDANWSRWYQRRRVIAE